MAPGPRERHRWSLADALAAICSLRNLGIVFGVVTVAIATIVSLPFVRQEFQLQMNCHLNDSHLAQENIRLLERANEYMLRMDNMRQNVQLCKDEADSEHSRANRSYWEGFAHAVIGLVLLEIGLFGCIGFLCCKLLFRNQPRRQQQQLGLQQ